MAGSPSSRASRNTERLEETSETPTYHLAEGHWYIGIHSAWRKANDRVCPGDVLSTCQQSIREMPLKRRKKMKRKRKRKRGSRMKRRRRRKRKKNSKNAI